MAVASVALDIARGSYLNDFHKRIWPDNILMPKLQEAHRDLQLELHNNGIPTLKEMSSTPIVVLAGATTVTLPTDLIEPIDLEERASGSSEDWIDMYERNFEPDIEPSTILIYWTWREDQIQLVGATTDREVRIYYYKGLTIPTDENSALGFIRAEDYLGPKTAAYAAMSVGNDTLAGICSDKAEQRLGRIIQVNVKGMQNLPVRRIPYRRGHRYIT